MTLLELVQRFCSRTGIPSPSFVVASTDAQVLQLKALVDEVCEDLCKRWTWTDLTEESTFTTLAAEDQGAIATLAPNGFLRILNETIYNRTLRLPLYGPMSARKWQAVKALPNAGPFYKYRIRGGHLLFNPAGTAGQTCAFEYASSFVVLASDLTTRKTYATADDDTFLLDATLILAGLRWKWKSEKGLPYAEEFSRYETLVADANGQDGTKPILDMGSPDASAMPGIFISPGSWPL